MDRTFVAIDVETTGLEAGVDEIIEVAAVKFCGDEVQDTFVRLVKPRHSLPLKISRLTGLTDEMLADAPRFSEIAPDLVRFVKSYPLVGHSVGFDLRMLQAQGMRFAQPSYDTFDLATLLLPQAPAYKLGTLAVTLGITHTEAHRALADADATRQVFLRMLERIEALDLQALSEINKLMARMEWPVRDLFAEVERTKARRVFTDEEQSTKNQERKDDAPIFGGQPVAGGRSAVIPLKPTGDERPLDVEAVRRFFAPDGPMGQAFEGYEQRPEQVSMAEAVAHAFNKGETLMVEAGTGVGKCLSGDAWITFESGHRTQIAEICRASELPTEPILCITASGKLIYQSIQGVHCNGVRPVWRLRTALGRTITATANHPLLTFTGWQQLCNLQVGDRIATPRSLPSGREAQFSRGAFIVGAMLGDGGCGYSASLSFTNFDPAVVTAVREGVAALGNVEMIPTRRAGRYRFRRLSLLKHQRSGLNLLLEKMQVLGKKAHTKHIPKPYFHADAETIGCLLAGLWDTDGTIDKRDGHPSITSVSEQMIREIQHLLLRLNVISRLRFRKIQFKGQLFTAWELTISDLNSKAAFYQTVGKYMVGEKKRRLIAWWESFGRQQYNSNDDLIPVAAWEIIHQERLRAGKSWYSIRETCVVASDRTREISRPKMQLIGQFLESPKLLEIADSDIYWDRIVAIEAAGEVETFDLTMEGEPNFVANDIVVHNSMAYLAPAAIYAAQRGERVVVSTNTINLQDQLFFKDIPDLQRLLAQDRRPPTADHPFDFAQGRRPPTTDGRGAEGQRGRGGRRVGNSGQPAAADLPFTAALLKGRGNYLCLRRYHALRRDERLLSDEVRTLLKVQLWLPTTTSGDKAELLLMDRENAAWGRINATLETCTKMRCPHFDECYLFRARREAEAAHLVVVNHALMLADLGQEANVFPPYDHLVIDEAHNLEDVATEQFGFEVDQARLLQFLDDLYESGGANIVGGLLAELPVHFRESAATQGDMDKATAVAEGMRPAVVRGRESVYDCFNRLTVFVSQEAEISSYDPRLRLTQAVRKHPAWAEVERAWENLGLHLNTIGDGLGKLEALLVDLAEAEMLEYDALLLRVQALKRYATEVRVNTGHIILGGSEELIAWLTFDRQREALTLSAVPLSVAELLQANLFSQKSTVVLASATLAVDGKFDYVKQRIGLDEPQELMLESPFDYQKQALVYIPQDIPEPNQKGYQPALEDAIIGLCAATGGRALVLFTANSALRQTYRAIQEPLEEQGIAVLGQGLDGSRRSLLERFKEFPRTVLLGTTSFWEGVDVVGDALSVLIIAKLPFSVPTDPVFAARSEGFADPFNEFGVPQSILRFKQGFGRLIRSREDRGIVAVLDKRLLTKKYGQMFLNSLPHTLVRSGPIKQLPGLAERFLANGVKRPPLRQGSGQATTDH